MMAPKIYDYKFNKNVCEIGYRVTTEDMKSLGLRKNSNIIQYEMNKWVHPIEKPSKGILIWGDMACKNSQLQNHTKSIWKRGTIKNKSF